MSVPGSATSEVKCSSPQVMTADARYSSEAYAVMRVMAPPSTHGRANTRMSAAVLRSRFFQLRLDARSISPLDARERLRTRFPFGAEVACGSGGRTIATERPHRQGSVRPMWESLVWYSMPHAHRTVNSVRCASEFAFMKSALSRNEQRRCYRPSNSESLLGVAAMRLISHSIPACGGS